MCPPGLRGGHADVALDPPALAAALRQEVSRYRAGEGWQPAILLPVLGTITQNGNMYRLVPFILLVLSPFLTGALDLGSNSDVQPVATLSTSLTESMGPAAHLWALPSDAVAGKGPGSRFTQKDKDAVKQDNASRNEGKNRCANCGVETVPGEQHKKGVTPPKNETQVDHVIPRAKGGPGDPDNGQVLCRECNIEKSDKAP